ncbi:hypothetical protein E6H28_01980 [Candidatus Bathyarchaeota archaeon]|nr:MAG: hypothetical protein E6H28_01980 [Candidatus Bathyarchaeota archaeon]
MSATVRLLKPIALPFLLIAAGMLGITLLPALPRASPASFTLFGRILPPAGWGAMTTTVTSPGPDLTVLPGETVTISLTSDDGISHNWGVDYNGNGVSDPGEPLSSNFGSTAIPFTFTATTTPGTYTYWCFIHKGPMFGKFIVSPPGPDYSVSSNPSSLQILQGASANSTISITSLNNFAGSVTLSSSSSSPPGLLTSSFSVNPIMVPQSGTAKSNFTITVPAGTSPASYSITVTAKNSTTFSHSATVTVTVVIPDFKIALSSSSLTVAPGSSENVTVTLTSLNGFSGTVSLTSTLTSPGPQVTFSPISVTLSPGGTVSSTLSVSAASSGAYSTPVPLGNYNVNVTGTSGSLVHSATLALTIGSSSGAGALPTLAIVGVGIASAVAIVVAGVYFLRRRSKPKT